MANVDVNISQSFEDDGIRVRHDDDGFERKVSYAEARAGNVQCGTCGLTLLDYRSLLQSMEDGIEHARGNPNAVEREAAIAALTSVRDRLVAGG